jgi:hypothetical protein
MPQILQKSDSDSQCFLYLRSESLTGGMRIDESYSQGVQFCRGEALSKMTVTAVKQGVSEKPMVAERD